MIIIFQKLLVFDSKTWNHFTVGQQMTNIK